MQDDNGDGARDEEVAGLLPEIAEGLTTKQVRAALCLARGGYVVDAAEEAKVSRRTVSRWRNEPAFQATVDGLREEIWDRLSARLLSAADELMEPYLEALLAQCDRGKAAETGRFLRAFLKRLQKVEEERQDEEPVTFAEVSAAYWRDHPETAKSFRNYASNWKRVWIGEGEDPRIKDGASAY